MIKIIQTISKCTLTIWLKIQMILQKSKSSQNKMMCMCLQRVQTLRMTTARMMLRMSSGQQRSWVRLQRVSYKRLISLLLTWMMLLIWAWMRSKKAPMTTMSHRPAHSPHHHWKHKNKNKTHNYRKTDQHNK